MIKSVPINIDKIHFKNRVREKPNKRRIKPERLRRGLFLGSFLQLQIMRDPTVMNNELHRAIFEKNKIKVKNFVNMGVDINTLDVRGTGCTPIYNAIIFGRVKIAEYLLSKKNIDVTFKDKEGRTALIKAVYKKNMIKVVKLLIQNGADPNETDNKGNCPLNLAIQLEHTAMVKLLLKNGANPNSLNPDAYGQHPLHRVCMKGQVDVVEMLLKHGANVNVRNNDLKTPLHEAAHHGHDIIVEKLMKNGANIEAEDHRNNRAIHLATFKGHSGCLKMLIKWGAKLDCKNLPNKTPLQIALFKNQLIPLHMIISHYPESFVEKINQETIFELALNYRTLTNAFKVLVYKQS